MQHDIYRPLRPGVVESGARALSHCMLASLMAPMPARARRLLPPVLHENMCYNVRIYACEDSSFVIHHTWKLASLIVLMPAHATPLLPTMFHENMRYNVRIHARGVSFLSFITHKSWLLWWCRCLRSQCLSARIRFPRNVCNNEMCATTYQYLHVKCVSCGKKDSAAP